MSNEPNARRGHSNVDPESPIEEIHPHSILFCYDMIDCFLVAYVLFYAMECTVWHCSVLINKRPEGGNVNLRSLKQVNF